MSEYSDFLESERIEKEWIKENGITLEIDKIYSQESCNWAKKHYKIIFVDDRIALGLCIYNQIGREFIGDYEMFNKNTGMKYHDSRRAYRLINEVKK